MHGGSQDYWINSVSDREPYASEEYRDSRPHIALVYGLVPAIVLGGTFVFGVAGLASGSDAGALTGGLVLLVGGLLTVALSLAVTYVLPAVLLNYAETDRLGAGFAVGDITPMLTNQAYMWAFAYVLVAGLGFGIIAGLLNVVPVLGAIASAFVGFYVGVMMAYSTGRRTSTCTSSRRPTRPRSRNRGHLRAPRPFSPDFRSIDSRRTPTRRCRRSDCSLQCKTLGYKHVQAPPSPH